MAPKTNNLTFGICIHSIKIAQDIIQKLSNGVVGSSIPINGGIMLY